MFSTLVAEALLVVALVSGLPLLASSIVGLAVSLVQAATQVQEQTVPFILRLVTVTAVLVFGADLFCGYVLQFTREMFASLTHLGALP
jgi:type III secretion protein S